MIRSPHIEYDSAGKPQFVLCRDGSKIPCTSLARKTARAITEITGWWDKNPQRMIDVGLKPKAARVKFYSQPRKEKKP